VLISLGFVIGCLATVFYYQTLEFIVITISIVFISVYFKPFSSVLLGFICAICVVWLHFAHFYTFNIPSMHEKYAHSVSVTVSEVISNKSPQFVKVKLSSINNLPINKITAPYVFLSVNHEAPLNEGDYFSADITLTPYRTIKNFLGYDKQLAAFKQRVLFKGKVLNNKISVTKANTLNLVYKYRGYISNVFENTQLKWLYYALLTGDKSIMTYADKNAMQKLGLSHVLAISGLHIGLVFGFGFYITKFFVIYITLRLNQQFNVSLMYSGVGLLCALVYVYLSDFLVSATRALIMLACYLFLYYLAKQGMRWRTILYALVLILMLTPFAVLNPGLYFSFIAVAIIFSVLKKINILEKGIFGKLSSLLFLQAALFIGLMPLSVYFFNGFSIAGFVLNLLVIPFLSIVLMPALFIISSVSNVFDISFIITFLDGGLYSLYSLLLNFPEDWQWVSIGEMDISTLILFYTAILLLFYTEFKWLVCIPISVGLMHFVTKEKPLWELNVFDVGHGLMVLVSENNRAFVYDFGPSYFKKYSRVNSVLLPYIKANNLTVNHAILSHNDNDHSGGLSHFIAAGYKKSLTTFHPSGLNTFCTETTARLNAGDDTRIKITSFKTDDLNNENDNSCVVRIVSGNFSVLLTGDISKKRELVLLKQDKQLESTILISGHHGSKTSSSEEFISVVKPHVVIHSSAYKGQWHFPSDEVVARFNKINAQQYVTGENGQVRIKFFATKMVIETAREQESYWFIKD
jgi:competence protein ComEC